MKFKPCGSIFWLAALLALIHTAMAASVRVAWNPSPTPETAGYEVHCVNIFNLVSDKLDVGLATSAMFENLEQGTLYWFFVTAYDGAGNGSQPTVGIYYETPLANRPPVLSPLANRAVAVGQPVTFTAQASDPDGNDLTYSLEDAPIGASIHPSTGQFMWTPLPVHALLTNFFTVVVRDNGSPQEMDRQTIAAVVLPAELGGSFYCLTVADASNGSVKVSPSDQSAGLGLFAAGTALTLTATPASGYSLAGWTVNGISVSSNVLSFPIDGNVLVTAAFVPDLSTVPGDENLLKLVFEDGKQIVEVNGRIGTWVLDVSTDLIEWREAGSGIGAGRVTVESTGSMVFYRIRELDPFDPDSVGN